jgi:hypothetical protein
MFDCVMKEVHLLLSKYRHTVECILSLRPLNVRTLSWD